MAGDLLWALGLAVAAMLTLLAELFLVSFGLLGLAALALAVGAVMCGFQVHPLVGWGLLALLPLASWRLAAWAMRRAPGAGVVMRQEITAEAGQRSAAEAAGALPGAEGVLVTDAMPTGRARFPGGEIDVQARTALARGARIRVDAIDGPMVRVVPAAGSTAGSPA